MKWIIHHSSYCGGGSSGDLCDCFNIWISRLSLFTSSTNSAVALDEDVLALLDCDEVVAISTVKFCIRRLASRIRCSTRDPGRFDPGYDGGGWNEDLGASKFHACVKFGVAIERGRAASSGDGANVGFIARVSGGEDVLWLGFVLCEYTNGRGVAGPGLRRFGERLLPRR